MSGFRAVMRKPTKVACSQWTDPSNGRRDGVGVHFASRFEVVSGRFDGGSGRFEGEEPAVR
ncbi:hypothetical protein FHS23_000639 [Prauserella isguenensis]|uniref:Uncharacterized protein n=1 Tax=Prauserella isguenensis TaxID=1470180 RepID=A0A839RX63_9PSEU|nr:hypothetical protein [Prauserella isguenensis]